VSSDVWVEWGTGSSYLSNRTSTQTITTFSNLVFYISNISQDVKYYYRVVARNHEDYSYGSTTPMLISEDNVINPPANTTTTQNSTYTPNYYPRQTTYNIGTAAPITITRLPENITTTSANIKGLALPGGSVATTGWFEWGTATSLGRETIHKNIGSVPSIDFSEILSELSPNTTYYFRAVIQNQRGISKGNIISFKTGGAVATNPAPYTPPVVSSKVSGNSVKKEIKDTKIYETSNEQSAAVAEAGKSFLPETLIGWFLFIILLLIIIILTYYLYLMTRKKKEDNEEKKDIE